MREFTYVAINKRGKSASGELLAKNSREAKEKLQFEGLTPLKLRAKGKSQKGQSKIASEAVSTDPKSKTTGKGRNG